MTSNRMKKFKEKTLLHPVMTFIILIVITILLSGFLSLLNIQATYSTYSNVTNSYSNTTEAVKSLFNLSGLKYIFTNTVSNFANFTVLSNLIIILIGMGIMEESGFLKTIVVLLTKRQRKKTVTFLIVLFCMLASIMGDLPYIVMIPLSALIFYYGKRNPMIGIITSFAALTCGCGLSILFTSMDSSLMATTILNASVLDYSYKMSIWGLIIINTVIIIISSLVITEISENYIAKKAPKYDFPEETLEDEIITKKQLKGLIYALSICLLYILIVIYNIIPGLPFSGNLLDRNQTLYIDKLFSYDSFFTNGFVFIITMLFVLAGLFYGIGAKTIKNNSDFAEDLGHSLDGTGQILVLIFMASTFISIFKQTNIGNTLVAALTTFIGNSNFTGLPLVLLLFICSIIANIFVPSSLSKWSIMASTVIPSFMKTGISPEFAQIVFRLGECVSTCLTPLLAYFVIYLAYMNHYNQSEKPIRLFPSLKIQLPYALSMFAICLVVIIIWYLTNIPLGIGSSISL